MIRTFLFFCLLVFFFSLLEAEEITLSLEEVVSLVLRENPEIVLKKNQLEEAKIKIKEAKTNLLFNLDLNYLFSETRGFYSRDTKQHNAQVSLRQPLYTGGKIINTIKLTQTGFEITEAILDKTKQEVVFNAVKAFYSLGLTKELVELNKEILENIKEHDNLLNIRYNNGQASDLEIEKLKTAKEEAEENLSNSLNQLQAYESLLKNLLFLNEEIKLKVIVDFKYAPEELAYDEAFVLALSKRPEIRQYEAQIREAETKKELIKSQSRPNLYALWDYFTRSHTQGLSGPIKNPNDYNVLGIIVTWPIFDGFKTRLQLEEALLEIESAKIAKDKLIKDINLELKTTYLKLKSALNKIKTKEKELSFYQRNLETVEEKYKQGQLSGLD
ncbi:MAG: TolC family protein [Candidatus Omnitrophica bacterium]|nr:TolC family protein [Candidatus Omnitrophota bacterium]